MASNMSFITFIFLFLVFIQGVSSIDGRPLNLGKSEEPQLDETTTKSVDKFNGDIQAERSMEESFAVAPPSDEVTGASQVAPPPPEHDTSDFRPTAPGHSPCVGHSFHNGVGKFNGDTQAERSIEESFTIATPSDGVTGASQKTPSPPERDTSDFTFAGPSAGGVGHSVHN